MIKKFILLILCTTLLSLNLNDIRAEHDGCKIIIGDSIATASILSNLASQDGSLFTESKKLLQKGIEEKINAPKRCLENCNTSLEHRVELLTTPRFVKNKQPSINKCDVKIHNTKLKPFEASGKQFDNFDSLYEWISNFTQGKGKDGEKLYDICDGGCSPRYTFRVQPENGKFFLDATASCGYPRDKEDNNYLITAKHVWECKK